jgi:hypothetical protein
LIPPAQTAVETKDQTKPTTKTRGHQESLRKSGLFYINRKEELNLARMRQDSKETKNPIHQSFTKILFFVFS